MLHVIEEAYAQAAQLDTYIAAELKKQYDAQMEAVQSDPAVDALATKLRAARTTIKDAQVRLKTTKEKAAAQKLVQEIQKQEASIRALGEQLRNAVESAKSMLPSERPLEPNQRRVAFDVADDGNSEEGLGRGLKIDDADNPLPLPDKPGAALNAKDLTKTNEEIMQDRFKKIKQTDPIKSGTVVMDPSYVVDETGKKRRAGWDVQTAFPSGRAPNAPLQDKAEAKKFVDKGREEIRVDGLKAAAKEATAVYEKAKSDRERLSKSIDDTKKNKQHWPKQLEGAQKKLALAEKNLEKAEASRIASGIAEAKEELVRARNALQVEKDKPARLAKAEADLIKATEAEAAAKIIADKAVAAVPAS
jgi:hypothetical protein